MSGELEGVPLEEGEYGLQTCCPQVTSTCARFHVAGHLRLRVRVATAIQLLVSACWSHHLRLRRGGPRNGGIRGFDLHEVFLRLPASSKSRLCILMRVLIFALHFLKSFFSTSVGVCGVNCWCWTTLVVLLFRFILWFRAFQFQPLRSFRHVLYDASCCFKMGIGEVVSCERCFLGVRVLPRGLESSVSDGLGFLRCIFMVDFWKVNGYLPLESKILEVDEARSFETVNDAASAQTAKVPVHRLYRLSWLSAASKQPVVN